MTLRPLFVYCLFSLPFFLHSQVDDLNIIIPDGPKPWSSLDINRSDEQFQFAIVTDRTGGRRPGVFMKGVRKLNLLQPEFVMSVGDLIDGYTEDVPELERQWEEFDSFIDSLQMPFFYTPGNHDITNAVMDSLYRARFGPTYYHFVYKDVLFMCLNSEDQYRGAGRGTISDPQYEYIKKTLAENRNVRWTLLFMHQPLWLQSDPKRWPDVEKLLADRPHNVFVGHVHHYVKYQRNNGRYYTLATTGGGSRLRGPALGEFDHITWVTMTEDGPIMANLALDGIYADDLVTETGYDFIDRLTNSAPVRITPPLLTTETYKSGIVRTEIRNTEDLPVFVQLQPRFSFDYDFQLPRDTITVAPNSVEVIEWELRSRRGIREIAELPAQPVAVHLTYLNGGSEMTFPFNFNVGPVQRRSLAFQKEAPEIDGLLEDWQELPFRFAGENPSDLQVSWGVRYDEDHLYIAARVTDDLVRREAGKNPLDQDFIGVVLNAEPLSTSIMRTGSGNYANSYLLAFSPQASGVSSAAAFQDRYDFTVQRASRTGAGGYTLEMAVPLSYVKQLQGDDWRHIRLNIGVQDWDRDAEDKTIQFWQPEWRGPDNRMGSGLFFRE